MAQSFESIASYCGGFEDKRILDVGTDNQGKWITELASTAGVKEVIGIGLELTPTQLSPVVRMERMDIRTATFEDHTFDLVVSRSAFEHVHDLPKALSEIKRILKPGGVMWARFGPVWSCSYGHHLWIRHENELHNYWNLILPPYCHLTMLPDELFRELAPKHGESLAQKIIRWIYNSNGQNRLFYEDYLEIFDKTGMEILVLAGTDNPKAEEIYGPMITPDLLEKLRGRYPRYRNFFSKGIFVVFRKTK